MNQLSAFFEAAENYNRPAGCGSGSTKFNYHLIDLSDELSHHCCHSIAIGKVEHPVVGAITTQTFSKINLRVFCRTAYAVSNFLCLPRLSKNPGLYPGKSRRYQASKLNSKRDVITLAIATSQSKS